MSSAANVTIHASQFPENVRRDLLESLRARRVNHKFHYDSFKQTQKWLALHETHSPARTDDDCLAIYEQSFKVAAERFSAPHVHVVGLGCGGGQKDTRLLSLLKASGKEIRYTPSDVSVAMTLVARQVALAVMPEENCFPFVCDLATAKDLSKALVDRRPALITFFGMIPNFEPADILPKLASLVGPEDWLLFSANLAPGTDYAAGVRHVLPQYDNVLTREWLLTFLFDLGVESGDGEARFTIEDDVGSGLKKIVARFHFTRPRRIEVDNECFEFRAGETFQLFFSYRYTPGRVQAALEKYGLRVMDSWIAKSGEEGVWLARRSA